MVSFENCKGGFDSVFKRSRMNVASPSPETLTLAQQRQTARNRKQKLVSKLRDSGFEEDLACSPISSPAKNEISLLMSQKPVAGQLCSWYLQYGDIGFRIQREKEAQFHPCKSLARQPQVRHLQLVTKWTVLDVYLYFFDYLKKIKIYLLSYKLNW